MTVEGQVFAPAVNSWQELAEQAQQLWATGDFERSGETFLTLQEASIRYCLYVRVNGGRVDSGTVCAPTLEPEVSLAPPQWHPVGRLDGSVSGT